MQVEAQWELAAAEAWWLLLLVLVELLLPVELRERWQRWPQLEERQEEQLEEVQEQEEQEKLLHWVVQLHRERRD